MSLAEPSPRRPVLDTGVPRGLVARNAGGRGPRARAPAFAYGFTQAFHKFIGMVQGNAVRQAQNLWVAPPG